MKLLISFACVVFCLAAICESKRCQTENDCPDGQCCVALLASGLTRRGVCFRLSRSGHRCNVPDAKMDFYGGKYLYFCPCQAGYSCTPRGLREGETNQAKILSKQRCQRDTPTSTSVVFETTSSPLVSNPEPELETSPQPEIEVETSPDPTGNDLEQGPGGERPRDDDCEDWTYGC